MPSKNEWDFLGEAMKTGAAGLLAYKKITADEARQENLDRLRAEQIDYQRGRDVVSDERHADTVAYREGRDAVTDQRYESEQAAKAKQQEYANAKPKSAVGGLMWDRDQAETEEDKQVYNDAIDNAIAKKIGSGRTSVEIQKVKFIMANMKKADGSLYTPEEAWSMSQGLDNKETEYVAKAVLSAEKAQNASDFYGEKKSSEEIIKEARASAKKIFRPDEKPKKPDPEKSTSSKPADKTPTQRVFDVGRARKMLDQMRDDNNPDFEAAKREFEKRSGQSYQQHSSVVEPAKKEPAKAKKYGGKSLMDSIVPKGVQDAVLSGAEKLKNMPAKAGIAQEFQRQQGRWPTDEEVEQIMRAR